MQVKWWLTINEPHSVVLGYTHQMTTAPSLDLYDVGGKYLVARTLLQGHAQVFHLYDKQFREIQQGETDYRQHSIICSERNERGWSFLSCNLIPHLFLIDTVHHKIIPLVRNDLRKLAE